MADIYHLTGSTLHRWKALRVCLGMLHQCWLRSQQMTALLAAASWCWTEPCARHSGLVWLYRMSHSSVKWSLATPRGCLLHSFTLIHWLEQNSTWLGSAPSLISHRCNCGWPDHVCRVLLSPSSLTLPVSLSVINNTRWSASFSINRNNRNNLACTYCSADIFNQNKSSVIK